MNTAHAASADDGRIVVQIRNARGAVACARMDTFDAATLASELVAALAERGVRVDVPDEAFA